MLVISNTKIINDLDSVARTTSWVEEELGEIRTQTFRRCPICLCLEKTFEPKRRLLYTRVPFDRHRLPCAPPPPPPLLARPHQMVDILANLGMKMAEGAANKAGEKIVENASAAVQQRGNSNNQAASPERVVVVQQLQARDERYDPEGYEIGRRYDQVCTLPASVGVIVILC